MREGDGEAMKSRQKDRLGDEDGEGTCVQEKKT